jgi:hypothetical protein
MMKITCTRCGGSRKAYDPILQIMTDCYVCRGKGVINVKTRDELIKDFEKNQNKGHRISDNNTHLQDESNNKL